MAGELMLPVTKTGFGVLIFTALLMGRTYLEQSPTRHMLFLLPGLAIAGAYIMRGLMSGRIIQSSSLANSGTILAVSAILFWMLPRYIDLSLENPFFEGVKFISIPTIIGGLLALCWPNTHVFFRGFLQANAISMIGVLAFLYTHAPVRICNSYLISDQYQLGINFLIAAFGLSLYWVMPLFFPQVKSEGESPNLDHFSLPSCFPKFKL